MNEKKSTSRFALSFALFCSVSAPALAQSITQLNVGFTSSTRVDGQLLSGGCSHDFVFAVQDGTVFSKESGQDCGGNSVALSDAWKAAPINSSKKYSYTCESKLGRPLRKCTNGANFPTSGGTEGVEKFYGTYSATLSSSELFFMDDGVASVSGQYETNGRLVQLSKEDRIVESIVVELSGNTCRVTSYSLRWIDVQNNAIGYQKELVRPLYCKVRRG